MLMQLYFNCCCSFFPRESDLS